MKKASRIMVVFSAVLLIVGLFQTTPASAGICKDRDLDGYYSSSSCGTDIDCNDNNASINPGAAEICSDGIDNNCNNQTDENGCMIAAVEFEIIASKTKVGESGRMASSFGAGSHNVVVDGNNVYTAFITGNVRNDNEVRLGISLDGGQTWEKSPIIAYGPDIDSDGVAIDVGPDSTIHIAWGNQTENAIYYSNGTVNTSGSWIGTTPVNVSTAINVSSYTPAISVDGLNVIHITFGSNSSPDIYYTSSADGGTTFSLPSVLASASSNNLEASIAADSTGNVFAAWMSGPSPWNVSFSRKLSGSSVWSTPVMVNGALQGGYPTIAVSDINNVYIGVNNYIAATSNGGLNASDWNQNQVTDSCSSGSIAVDNAGILNYVCETSGGSVIFTRSTDNGMSWLYPSVIDTKAYLPHVAVNSLGKAFIMFDSVEPNGVIYFTKEK